MNLQQEPKKRGAQILPSLTIREAARVVKGGPAKGTNPSLLVVLKGSCAGGCLAAQPFTGSGSVHGGGGLWGLELVAV